MTTDTRPPLRLTKSEAANWTRFHPEDHGRAVVIVEWTPAPVLPGQWPPRPALGQNAPGAWVWRDEMEGRWP